MPLGLYTQLRSVRPLRSLLEGRRDRTSRRARHFPRSRPYAGRAAVVHPRLRRVPVPQQCDACQRQGRRRSSSRWSSRPRCRARRRIGRRTSPSPSTGTRSTPGRRRPTIGDKRGKHTPDWWKLAGSQYGDLKHWRVTKNGTYRDGAKVSKCSLADLELERHRSIRIRIGVKDDARHPGGINIFGSGFGNYSKDIVLRLLKA